MCVCVCVCVCRCERNGCKYSSGCESSTTQLHKKEPVVRFSLWVLSSVAENHMHDQDNDHFCKYSKCAVCKKACTVFPFEQFSEGIATSRNKFYSSWKEWSVSWFPCQLLLFKYFVDLFIFLVQELYTTRERTENICKLWSGTIFLKKQWVSSPWKISKVVFTSCIQNIWSHPVFRLSKVACCNSYFLVQHFFLFSRKKCLLVRKRSFYSFVWGILVLNRCWCGVFKWTCTHLYHSLLKSC